MLKESSAPTTTHESCAETVSFGREMRGDQEKDIHREAVYGNEGVDPIADDCQCG